MISPQEFVEIQRDLEGKTQLEKPRVQKKVMVDVLRSQNSIMQTMSAKLSAMDVRIQQTEGKVDHMGGKIKNMGDNVNSLDVAVHRVSTRLKSIDEKMHHMEKKNDSAIDKVLKSMKEVNLQTTRQAEEMASLRNEMSNALKNEASERNQLSGKVALLEGQLRSLADSIEMTADSVTCPSEEGQTLTEVLLKVKLVLNELNEDQRKHKDILVRHGDDLNDKAPITLESDLWILEQKIRALEEKSNRQDDLNIENMLIESQRAIQETTANILDLKKDVSEKANKEEVEEVIEEKYEEIIEHLQSALSSAADDEAEFKRVARELQDIIQQLNNSKADKQDLVSIKEQLLYDSRLSQQLEQLRLFVEQKADKEEVGAKLANKPDRAEVEQLLGSVGKLMKRQMRRAEEDGGEIGDGYVGNLGHSRALGGFGAARPSSVLASVVDGGGVDLRTRTLTGPCGHHSMRKGGGGGRQPAHCLSCHSKLREKGRPLSPPPDSSFGGGFVVPSSANQQNKGPALRVPPPDLLPVLDPMKQNSLIVGVDGLIYHGAAPSSIAYMAIGERPETR